MADHPGRAEITARHFPTPALALKSNDPDVQARVCAFAELQADAARHARNTLLDASWSLTKPYQRGLLLEAVYQQMRWWRYGIAAATTPKNARHTAEHFLRPIVDGDDNYDRLGAVGRLRQGAKWDAQARTLIGGEPTPASQIMVEMGKLALARFDREGPDQDVLQNWVTLPHSGERVSGNRLLRGNAAQAAAQELVNRQRRRGNSIEGFDVGGELVYAATARVADRSRIHLAVVELLAGDNPSLASWCEAVYLLGQAPLDKKGSDAVNRTFAVAVGAVILDGVPVLAHDVDLRSMVLPQEVFVDYLAAINRTRFGG